MNTEPDNKWLSPGKGRAIETEWEIRLYFIETKYYPLMEVPRRLSVGQQWGLLET
jgi:hypothetical protein